MAEPAIVPGRGQLAVQFDGPVEVCHRLAELLVLQKSVTAIVVRSRRARFEAQDLVVIIDGLVQLALGEEYRAAIVIGGREAWIDPERGREVGNGVFGLALGLQGQSAIVEQNRLPWVQPNGPRVRRDRRRE